MRRRRGVFGVVAALAVATAFAGPGAEAQEVPSTTVAPVDTVTPEEPAPTTEPVPTTTVISEGTPSPAPEGSRDLSGTIQGIDGKAVNAQISLVLRDSQDFPLNMDGTRNPSRAAYAVNVSINSHLPVDGGPPGGGNTTSWHIDDLPSQAHHFTLEVYPRASGSGAGNFSHYGGAVKRNLVLRAGQNLGNINIVFPLNCTNVQGGTTGSIRVRHYVNGQPSGNLTKFVATGADFPAFGIQGFRDQRDIPAGDAAPEFDGLAPDRRYGVEIFVDPPGGAARRFTFFEVPVRACERTDVIISEGSPSVVPPRFTPLAFGAPGPGLPVPGDFDGDGDDDIYFATPNGGELWTSTGNGTTFVKTDLPSTGTHRVVAGDWDGDGIDDLFFYGAGARADRIWDFAGDGSHQVVPTTANMGGNRTYPVAGDFDFNRRTDILFVTPGGSTMRRFTAAGHTDTRIAIPAGFTVRAGDFDGDWQADLFLYRSLQNYGEVEAWQTRANGTSFTRHAYRIRPGQFQLLVGDVSGDFKADLIFYQPGSAIDLLWRGRGPSAPFFAQEMTNVGITGRYLPTTGDWNGDGTDDLFLYGPGTAPDKIWRSNGPAWLLQQRQS